MYSIISISIVAHTNLNCWAKYEFISGFASRPTSSAPTAAQARWMLFDYSVCLHVLIYMIRSQSSPFPVYHRCAIFKLSPQLLASHEAPLGTSMCTSLVLMLPVCLCSIWSDRGSRYMPTSLLKGLISWLGQLFWAMCTHLCLSFFANGFKGTHCSWVLSLIYCLFFSALVLITVIFQTIVNLLSATRHWSSHCWKLNLVLRGS